MDTEEKFELNLSKFKESWLRTKGCNQYQLSVKKRDDYTETLVITQTPATFSDRPYRQQKLSIMLVFDEDYNNTHTFEDILVSDQKPQTEFEYSCAQFLNKRPMAYILNAKDTAYGVFIQE